MKISWITIRIFTLAILADVLSGIAFSQDQNLYPFQNVKL
jgi:hypothetical protein